MRISVFGLGKLGAPLAAVLASRNHEVIGVDVDPRPIRQINAGVAPVNEPDLQALMERCEHLSATTSVETAIHATDVSFVIVPTPTNGSGGFSNEHVLRAVSEIGCALRSKDSYHLVTVTSTVMPGSTGGEISETLERSSDRRVGRDVGLCYNPEFVALGSVVRDMLRPDLILIGESDRRAGDVLAALYGETCDNNPPIERMNFVNAELTKIAVNTFVTTKISYANMLADICDRLPGADVDTVTGALGQDSRIGPKYLRGALSYGGPCFPRDNVALGALARRVGAPADIAEATDRINTRQIERLATIVRKRLKGGTVGILGLAYKPGTDVIEESAGIALAEALARSGYRVVVFDPLALESAAARLGDLVEAAPSAERCVRTADLVVITTPWDEFSDLPPAAMTRLTRRRLTIVDCWRLLSAKDCDELADIVYPGHGDHFMALPADDSPAVGNTSENDVPAATTTLPDEDRVWNAGAGKRP